METGTQQEFFGDTFPSCLWRRQPQSFVPPQLCASQVAAIRMPCKSHSHKDTSDFQRNLQHTPNGTYPRSSTTCLWFGNPFPFMYFGVPRVCFSKGSFLEFCYIDHRFSTFLLDRVRNLRDFLRKTLPCKRNWQKNPIGSVFSTPKLYATNIVMF